MKPKIVIIGLPGHGKDTVANLISQLGDFAFSSTSMQLVEKVICPAIKDKYNYTSFEECYAARDNHRVEWAYLLSKYNSRNPTRFAEEVLLNYDIYCGLRCKRTLDALYEKDLIAYSIFVDALIRKGRTSDAIDIDISDCDYIIDNNLDERALVTNVRYILNRIL